MVGRYWKIPEVEAKYGPVEFVKSTRLRDQRVVTVLPGVIVWWNSERFDVM